MRAAFDARQSTKPVRLVMVLTMATLSLTEAQAHLSRLVARVGGQQARVTVTVVDVAHREDAHRTECA